MSSQLSVDLNCDMGESFGSWIIGNDEAILPYISSANIACGFHAGDPSIILKTVALALKYQVAIGAHPGFADLAGFGRREIQVSPREVYALTVYQIGAIAACAKAQGGMLHHVKPHGALYNMAVKDVDFADAITQAIYDTDPNLILYALSGSELIHAATKKGLPVYHEVFADRTYQLDGKLTPRTDEDAIIMDTRRAVEQVVNMVKYGKVNTLQGSEVFIQADTICLHGDHKGAVNFAKDIHQALRDENIAVR